MTKEAVTPKPAFTGIRTALGVGGVLALIVGVLILVWPGRTAIVVAAIIAIYALVAGLVYACLGVFSKGLGAWSRVGHIVLGAVFVIAGIVAFANLSQTTVALAVLLGVMVGVMWIVEGVVALSALGGSASKAWSIVFAIISILAGIMLMFSPMWGAAVLWWILGISLCVLGIMNIVRAFTFGKQG
ncbi:HdeD family acid-resistance protein [Microbacterium sp. A82]|uniref:HdeD family acid-resistance protein n=1 Tax=unclassified Microbacterium TaxID=2609290 RepID=UPI003F2B7F1D